MFDELARESAGSKSGGALTMEVSSHALALGRVHGIRFRTAVFSNLTRDHLDFHGTMEDYFAAKRTLFVPLDGSAPPPEWAVLNYDDGWAHKIQPPEGTRVLWYGMNEGAAYRAEDISFRFEGLRFRLKTPDATFDITSPLVGRHNVYNILAAICTGVSYSVDMATIIEGIANCQAVPGAV